MRISFAALSIAFMLSIGCGGTEDTATTAQKDAPAASEAGSANAGEMAKTDDSTDDVNAEDVVLVKLELPGMT